jgi:class 3 adenylate cyclase
MRYLILLLGFLFLAEPAGAQSDSRNTFIFDAPLRPRYELDRHLERLDDSSCALRYEDIAANPDISNRFAHRPVKTRNQRGYCGWLRFSFRNNTGRSIYYMLGIPAYDISELYEAGKNPSQQRLYGGSMPFHAKLIEGRSHIFPLVLEGGEQRTFYLRVKTDGFMPQNWFRLTLEHERIYLTDWYFFGFYLGILLLLICISFGLAAIFRDPHYLVLSLPLIGMLLWFGDMNGDLHLMLNTPLSWRKYGHTYFTSVFLPVSTILFPAYYTTLRRKMPWAFYTLHAFVLIVIGFTAGEIVSHRSTPYHSLVLLSMYIFLFFVIGSLALKGDRGARSYFLFGLPFFLTGVYWLVSNVYAVKAPIANLMLMQIGSLLSSLIIGYELFNRVTLTIRDRINALHENRRLIEGQNLALEEKVAARTLELKAEQEKSDRILRNILPAEVAAELKEKGSASARLFEHVSVLFTDFVNFTKAGEKMSPQELVDELHECFKAFDEIIARHGMEKIKTIGDAYLAVAGLPIPNAHHACTAADVAIEIQRFMRKRRAAIGSETFEVRIGIHSGPVVAGIVGVMKFAYDIWGDTVNTAARMEQNSEPGRINISQATYDLIKKDFECSYRGEIAAKHKGALRMYFVEEKSVPVLS